MSYSYTITRTDGCFLVKGNLRADDFISLTELAGKGAIVCPNLARLAEVNFALGQPEAIAALTAMLINRVPAQLSGLKQWIKTGEHGSSSLAMVSHLAPGAMPLLRRPKDHPHDPDDLARCRELLETAPELLPLLPKMAEVSSVWAGLIGNWTELCKLMDSEAPDWRSGRGMCEKTYQLMRNIIGGKTP